MPEEYRKTYWNCRGRLFSTIQNAAGGLQAIRIVDDRPTHIVTGTLGDSGRYSTERLIAEGDRVRSLTGSAEYERTGAPSEVVLWRGSCYLQP